jgi:hypothetical protein
MMAAQQRLEQIDEEGVIAYLHRRPIEENPHEQGTPAWWMWRLAYLREQQSDEYEQSPEYQVDLELAEQQRWERREKTGINELVERVCRRTRMLGGLFGHTVYVPHFLLENNRHLLRESVDELLSRVPERF